MLCHLLQYSSENLLDGTLEMITDPDDMGSTTSLLNLVKSGNDIPEQFEKIYLKRDGSKFYSLSRTKVLRLQGEDYLVIFMDGFEQYHSARTRLEKQYRDIIEFSGDVFFTVDPSGNFTYANEVASEVTGLTAQEILKTNYLDLVSPSHQKEVYEFFSNHFSSKADQASLIFPITSKSGEIVWLDQKLSTIWSESKFKIFGYSAAARNITKEYETSTKLKESESHYQALFNDSPTPLLLQDLSSVKNCIDKLKKKGITQFGKYFQENIEEVVEVAMKIKNLKVSKELIALHEAESAEDYFINYASFHTEQSFEEFQKELIAIAEGKMGRGAECEMKTKSGEDIVVFMKWGTLPGYEDTFSRVLTSFTDVTPLREKHSALQIAEQELSSLNDDLLEEIKLRKKIQLNLVNIEERERKRMARELHDGLGQKLTAVKFTLGAIRRSAKLESSQMEILSESIKIIEETMGEVREISHNLIPAVLKDFGMEAAISKICDRADKFNSFDVTYHVRGKIPKLAEHIETALYRIAQEIMNNASKYSNANTVVVNLTHSRGELNLFIKDDGIGFDMTIDRVGMGLKNMKERCAMIDAKCDIKSTLGVGTTTSISYNNV